MVYRPAHPKPVKTLPFKANHVPPKDPAVKRMEFEKSRKEKINYRKQMLKEWKLGQAQNLKDTYTSLMVRPQELNPGTWCGRGTRCTLS